MRYAAGHKEEAKARILAAAGKGFRKLGYGAGVDALAKEAGVTSGAFYGHFRSKAAAFQAAVQAGLRHLRLGFETFQAQYGADWIDKFTAYYTGPLRQSDLAESCALPSLSAEVGRADDAAKDVYQRELLAIADIVATHLPAADGDEKRRQAWAMLALLTGGMVLARGVREDAVAEDISAAVRAAVRQITERQEG